MTVVLGVVPLLAGPDRTGSGPCPGGSALRELAGIPLLVRATSALARSGCVGRVVVLAPEDLREAAVEALRRAPAWPAPGGRGEGVPVDVAPLPPLDGAAPVVVHDPHHALAPPELVRAVVDALTPLEGERPPVGAVAVRPVTDTLKWVDGAGVVAGTADRDRYRVVCSPQAYPAEVLRAVLDAGRDGHGEPAWALRGLARRAARLGPLRAVPAPQEVFPIADDDDLALADALQLSR